MDDSGSSQAEFLGTLCWSWSPSVSPPSRSASGSLAELLGRGRSHRTGLWARARRPRLCHRPDLGLPRQPGRDAGLHRGRANEVGRGRRLPRGPVRRGHRRGLPPLLDVHDFAAVPQVHSGARCRRLRPPVAPVREPGGRLPDRGRADRRSSSWSCSSPPTRRPIQGAAGVAIGFALVFVHLIGIPLTGTSVNPARSLGPALVLGRHGPQPGLALHRGPAGWGARRRGDPSRAGRPLQGGRRGGGRRRPATGARPGGSRYGRTMDLTEALPFARGRRQACWPPIRSNGRPQLSNIMFVPGEGDTLRISVTDDRAKTANLRRDPRASLYVPATRSGSTSSSRRRPSCPPWPATRTTPRSTLSSTTTGAARASTRTGRSTGPPWCRTAGSC